MRNITKLILLLPLFFAAWLGAAAAQEAAAEKPAAEPARQSWPRCKMWRRLTRKTRLCAA